MTRPLWDTDELRKGAVELAARIKNREAMRKRVLAAVLGEDPEDAAQVLDGVAQQLRHDALPKRGGR